ncbi:unnamed protein product [Peniophora sp. CBMAI 1063]|nr:unnamed protein product [Peniophora sp. CBMAI 1063]
MSFGLLWTRTSLHRAYAATGAHSSTLLRRLASTSSFSLSFPAGPNPTPWQIFHLPPNASQQDIKTRYYELVRRYHPDSPVARSLPPEMAHAQFQAVSRAYDVLRGKTPSMAIDDSSTGPMNRRDNDVGFEIWKARQARKADIDVTFDERWKDKMLVGILLFAVFSFVAQILWARRRKIETALQEKVSYRQTAKPTEKSGLSESAANPLPHHSTPTQEKRTTDPHQSEQSTPSPPPDQWSLGPRI